MRRPNRADGWPHRRSLRGPVAGLLLLAACFLGTGQAAAVPRDVFLKLSPSVVRVEAFNPDGSVSIGSGVMVGKGAVATNCHVTQRALRIDLIKGGWRWPALRQNSDLKRDVCVLFSRPVDVPVVAMSREKLKPGQAVTAVGFIGGLGPRLAAGQIKALHDYDEGKVIQSSTEFSSGASGGGLFDEEGRLVGLVTFKALRAGGDFHFSLPLSWIEQLLDDAEANPVGPLPYERPFWQRVGDQPLFLRALAMEAANNWFGLLAIAGDWTRAEPSNAHSWVSLGKAHLHLAQRDEAITAFRAAIALDEEDWDAWFQMGLAFADEGEEHEVKHVHTVLMGIDRNIADEFAEAVHREPATN